MVSFSLGAVSFLLISVFIIATLGYMLGRSTIKGVSLGTAGVFIVALAYGAIFGPEFTDRIRIGEVAYASEALKTRFQCLRRVRHLTDADTIRKFRAEDRTVCQRDDEHACRAERYALDRAAPEHIAESGDDEDRNQQKADRSQRK